MQINPTGRPICWDGLAVSDVVGAMTMDAAAAERLQLPRKTLYDKLQKHRLLPQDYRDA
jgi:hypothetical protein